MLLIIFLISVISLIYLRWTYTREYWRRRNVPYLPPYPMVGNLTFLQRVNPGIWMRQLNHFDPYVGVWWFWRPVLIINSPEIAKNVLVKDFGNFKNRLLASGANDPLGALNIFTVDDPIWSEVRRSLTKVFSSAKLKQIHPFMMSKSGQLVQRIKKDIDTEINLREVFVDYTTDIISTFAFGIESDATLTGEGPLRTVATGFMTYDLYRGLAWCSIFFWPELVELFRFTFYPKSATDYFRRVIDTLSAQYVEKGNSGQSVLDILIRLREENQDSELYTNDLIVAQAAIFMLGGFDTTASMITFIIYELAHNTEIQEKLFDELENAKQMSNNPFDYKQLSELNYLDCVIKEGLRKYPPMGWLDRKAIEDYNIDDKLTIKAGTPIYVNTIGMHYNPKYFPNPEEFDPDRFLPENEKNIQPYTYMPFGDGPRNCVGQRFAMLSLRTAVSKIISNFRISPLPNKPVPSKVQIERRGLFYSPGEKLSVKFTSRV
ncbi:cytochrome P450 6k1-like [Aricia agestis]|uniref:cytochrome P450 6k1-like n=1 Tax=Aricia agestis TaxID=91739 RepID=UPI001C20887E|nr:cytochrome P450 6k1-like [Aricia agestis]